MSLTALIDGDVVAHRVGYSCESKVTKEMAAFDGSIEGEKTVLPVEIAYARLVEMMNNILLETGATSYRVFLTDSDGNFRKQVAPHYKANRKDMARPVHLKALEAFLIQEYGAIRAVGEEADDALSSAQCAGCGDTIIVSIDKDLLQCPGLHYNFVKKEFHEVSDDDGQYFFYKQLLMGDSTDNIAGCPGIGEKKAEKALRPYYGNETHLFQVVYENYERCFPELVEEELEELITTVGRLVYIRRKVGELWTLPKA